MYFLNCEPFSVSSHDIISRVFVIRLLKWKWRTNISFFRRCQFSQMICGLIAMETSSSFNPRMINLIFHLRITIFLFLCWSNKNFNVHLVPSSTKIAVNLIVRIINGISHIIFITFKIIDAFLIIKFHWAILCVYVFLS